MGRWNLHTLTPCVRGVSILAVHSHKQNKAVIAVIRWLPHPIVLATLTLPGISVETVDWDGGPVICSCWVDGKRRLIRWDIPAAALDDHGRVADTIRRAFDQRAMHLPSNLSSHFDSVPAVHRCALQAEEEAPTAHAAVMWVPCPGLAPFAAVHVSGSTVAFACAVSYALVLCATCCQCLVGICLQRIQFFNQLTVAVSSSSFKESNCILLNEL